MLKLCTIYTYVRKNIDQVSYFIIAMILFEIFFTKRRVVQCEIYLKMLYHLVFILITFFNILFTNKQIQKILSRFLEKTTMKGKFQICIILSIRCDTIKNVEVMFGSICHVVRLLLRDYPSVVVLMKMPYLVNMTIWSTLPILNDK